MWDLDPRPGMEPGPPALGAQSLTHWTAREVPSPSFWTNLIKSLPCFNISLREWSPQFLVQVQDLHLWLHTTFPAPSTKPSQGAGHFHISDYFLPILPLPRFSHSTLFFHNHHRFVLFVFLLNQARDQAIQVWEARKDTQQESSWKIAKARVTLGPWTE